MTYFIKTIHIELANKGREITMLEVLRQHDISKTINILYIKRIFGGCPLNIFLAAFILILEHICTQRMLQSFYMNVGMLSMFLLFLFFDIFGFFLFFLLKNYYTWISVYIKMLKGDLRRETRPNTRPLPNQSQSCFGKKYSLKSQQNFHSNEKVIGKNLSPKNFQEGCTTKSKDLITENLKKQINFNFNKESVNCPKIIFGESPSLWKLKWAVKILPAFMLNQFYNEVETRLKTLPNGILRMNLETQKDSLFRILIHVINKNLSQSQFKREQSRACIKIYLSTLINKKKSQNLPLHLQYTDLITTVCDPQIYEQNGGTCYAHAVAQAIYSVQKRVIGRVSESHGKIARRLINKYGNNGGYVYQCLKDECKLKKLQFRKIDIDEAIRAIIKGQVVVGRFNLTRQGWKKYILRKDNGQIMSEISEKNNKNQETTGHAVAIVGIDTRSDSWIVKNSWGVHKDENSKYRRSIIKIETKFNLMTYYEVFFSLSDLTQTEKFIYEKLMNYKENSYKELKSKEYELINVVGDYFAEKRKQKNE